MKILAVHPGIDFSVADVYDGWVAAFRKLGITVIDYNLNDRLSWYVSVRDEHGKRLEQEDAITLASAGLEAACWRHQPDLVFVVSSFYVPDGIWHGWRNRVDTVLLCTESPYEDDMQLGLVDRVEPDIVLLNDPTHLTRYRDKTSRRVYYMPHAYDPAKHYPNDGERPVDFTFVGTAFPSRQRLFEAVDWDGMTVRFAGNWRNTKPESILRTFLVEQPESCTPNEQAADMYRHAKTSANLYRGNDEREANRRDLMAGWSMGPREVELAACGTFFCRESRGEGDLIFPMLPVFETPEELTTLLRWYLANDAARLRAAEQARAAIAHRTFDAHARRLMRLIRK